MWKVWPGCFDDLFRVRNVSHCGHLLISSAGFLLCSTQVLAALPHLPKVVNLGHSVQFPFLHLFLYFHVISVFIVSNAGSAAAKIPILARANFLRTSRSQRVLPVVADCLQPITSRPSEKLASTPTPWGIIEIMSRPTLERSAYLEWVSSCWHHQSVMSGNQNVLLSSIWSEW